MARKLSTLTQFFGNVPQRNLFIFLANVLMQVLYIRRELDFVGGFYVWEFINYLFPIDAYPNFGSFHQEIQNHGLVPPAVDTFVDFANCMLDEMGIRKRLHRAPLTGLFYAYTPPPDGIDLINPPIRRNLPYFPVMRAFQEAIFLVNPTVQHPRPRALIQTRALQILLFYGFPTHIYQGFLTPHIAGVYTIAINMSNLGLQGHPAANVIYNPVTDRFSIEWLP